VYVLGDLFDAWIGDDQLREPLPARVAAALHALADAGVPVAVMTGNRDVLLGPRFADAAGATLLPERIVVDVAGTPTLLLHGDVLCTGDVAYQRFRAIARDPRWQRRFLALPYALRHGVAGWLRRKSREATAAKPEAILDVEPRAVEAAFREAAVAQMIHGHTHRPARHTLAIDGRNCERWVLADWYDRGSYLECDGAGIRARAVAAPA
jgi:UDP-2,3-diacylglucosamine hydrolase